MYELPCNGREEDAMKKQTVTRGRRLLKRIAMIMVVVMVVMCVESYIPATTSVMGENIANQENDIKTGTFGWYSYEILADDTIKITKCNVIFESEDMHTEDLSIPGQIEGKKVVCIGSYAFTDLNQAILNVTIPDGVTTIENNAFEECKNIACVTLPDTVANIGEKAFYNCKELESINIPKNAVIGKDAFAGCDKLKLDNEQEQTTVNETTPAAENSTTVATKNETTTAKEATTENVAIEKTKINKVTKKLASKKAVIKLKKVNGAKYQVMISMTKKFNKKKTITRKVNKATFTVKNKILQKKKVLYVKARAYKVLNGKIYYSKWSNVKNVVIKK